LLKKTFELNETDKVIKILTLINDFKQDKILDKLQITLLATIITLPKEYEKKRFANTTKLEIVEKLKNNGYPRFTIASYNYTLLKLRKLGLITTDTDKVLYLSKSLDFLKDLNGKEFKMELIFK
jgi:hypothetical protein